MNKILLLITFLCLLFFQNTAISEDDFLSLENLTPPQRLQVTNIQNNFKIQNNDLEMRISSYMDKIAKLQNDRDKTKDQIMVLAEAYERNIATLKEQQQKLIKETDAAYKSVLTEEQYKQYQALQNKVQDAFTNFLKK